MTGPGTDLAARFRLIEATRAGGMATVWRASDLSTGADVAVKVLAAGSSDEIVARFDREARILASLDHDAVVRYIAHGLTADGVRWLAEEWLAGEDLGERVRRADLTIGEAARVASRVAAALGTLHDAGVVHRDVKPSNIFLPGGRTAHAKLIDLGIALRSGGETVHTPSGFTMGSPGYMAPEQGMSGATTDTRADLYSLGCVLFRCLAGRPPFLGDSPVALMVKAMLEDAPRLSELRSNVPAELDELVARLLARDPDQRPRDAAEVADALARFGPSRAVTRRRRAPSLPAIGAAEQHLVALVLAAVADDERARARAWAASNALAPLVLADGVLVLTVTGHSVATDQSRHAAALATELRAAAPGATIAVATGRAEIGGRLPYGEAVDRAAALLEPRVAGVTRLDELTAGLLEPEHPLVRAGAPGTRTLLGAPSPFVGRTRELGFLEALHRETAEDGVANAALVSGPPGVGKSRLRVELATRLRARGEATRVVEVRAAPGEGGPYALLAAVARGLDRALDLSPGAATDAADAAAHDAIVAGDRLRRGALAWLEAELARGPLAVLLDDVQWADRPSIDLLDEALRLMPDRPLLVIGFARPLEPAPWRERRFTAITLGDLPARAAGEIVRRALPDAGDDLVDRVVRRAGGNAFYLEEIVRALAGGAGADDLPATVIAMAQARLEGVDADARRLLRAASVLGRTFVTDGVAALLGSAERTASIERSLRALVDAEVLVFVAPGFGFRHDLLREAAYAMLTDDDRVAGHVRAARWLEERDRGDANAAAIAEHYRSGDRPELAIERFVRAAARALEASDFAAAALHGEAALACGAADGEAGRAHALVAHACRWLGRHGDSMRHAQAAMRALTAEDPEWYRCAGMVANAAGNLGDMESLVAVANALCGCAPAPGLIGWLAVALARAADRLLLSGRSDFAEGLLARLDAIETEPDVALPGVRGWVRRARGFAALSAGDAERFVAAMLAAADDFDAAGDQRDACLQRGNAGYGYLQLGAAALAEQQLRAARATAIALGLSNVVTSAEADLGVALAWLDQRGEAIEVLTRVVAAARAQGNPRIEAGARANLALVHLADGAVDRAAEVVAGGATLPAAMTQRALLAAAAARVELAAGRAPAALTALAPALAALAAATTQLEGESLIRVTHADALAAAGRDAAARDARSDAAARVHVRAARIADPHLRAAFLEQEPWNARALVRSTAR